MSGPRDRVADVARPSEMTYQPRDTMHLWWLAEPERPRPIGALNLLVATGRGVSLRYDAAWLETGLALSEDLPLLDHEFLPRQPETAVGAVDDARPDRWGERVIRLLDRPGRLSLLEMLYFAGDDRFGALGVSLSATDYEPWRRGGAPRLDELETIQTLVDRVIRRMPIDEHQRRLLTPGATFGGARPKALVEIDGEEWIVKFAEDAWSDEPLIEHAAMTLAARAGITVAATRGIPLPRGATVAVRRFDRVDGRRRHALSAHVALRAAGHDAPSYPALAELLRRRGSTVGGASRAQMRELFRRMLFNILIDNTDDHEKTHALLVDDRQQLQLAPAYDVLPTGKALGYQGMAVGNDGASSTLDNALSRSASFGLSPGEARREMHVVASVVAVWREHFRDSGVPAALIDEFGQHIDRPFLLDQRDEAMRSGVDAR